MILRPDAAVPFAAASDPEPLDILLIDPAGAPSASAAAFGGDAPRLPLVATMHDVAAALAHLRQLVATRARVPDLVVVVAAAALADAVALAELARLLGEAGVPYLLLPVTG